MIRRTFVMSAAAGIVALGLAAPANAFEPSNVECIAPANPGGGWDFTCRQIGKLLSDLDVVPGTVQVTNMAGGGGGVAYSHVVTKRNEDPNLIVAASTATATRLAQNQFAGLTADQVHFVGALGADYGVLVVAKDSPHQDLASLVEAVKADPTSISFAGGSAAGGFDHLKVLQVLKAGGFEDIRSVRYISFDGGGDAITQMLGGHVQAMTGDISEAVGFIQSGDVRVLAVLSQERLPGEFGEIPTAQEQGFDVVAPNWRGFYVPKGTEDEVFEFWAEALRTVGESNEWQEIMAANGLMPFFKVGDDFQGFVDDQIRSIQDLSREIGVIQ
ncbi:MAG: tripartite tricarboxylate transporter substrate binding protein [Geminicoccaceae bacterium]|nr:tripartite tricarboxylate transporter substrate binding protein [Geminicoccaceae bacterium]